jgi:hypothetical protein
MVHVRLINRGILANDARGSLGAGVVLQRWRSTAGHRGRAFASPGEVRACDGRQPLKPATRRLPASRYAAIPSVMPSEPSPHNLTWMHMVCVRRIGLVAAIPMHAWPTTGARLEDGWAACPAGVGLTRTGGMR